MKNIIILLLTLTSVYAQNKQKNSLSFDGIYETKKCENIADENEEKSFLRFYPNKKVISVGTECDATVFDLKSWFNLEMEYPSVGVYEIKNNKIEFSTTSANGTVKYKGRFKKNGFLKLKVKSLINGFKSREKYTFVKIVDLK